MNDILQQEGGDLALTDDLTMGEATRQHVRDLLLASPGDYKEVPTVGVDAASFLRDVDAADFLRTVRIQCEQDGMRVERIQYDREGALIIEAEYENDHS